MSMHDLADPGEGAWLEAEIQRELAQLSPVHLEEEEDGEDGLEQEEDFQESLDYDEEVPESLAAYLERVESRAGLVEEGLKECEDVMHHTVTQAEPGAVVPFTSTDLLDQLAATTGQNPAELKRKVLEEIEAEERDDDEEIGMLDENSNSVEQEEEGGGGQPGAVAGTETGETAGAEAGEKAETGAVMLYGVDDLERQLTLQLRRFHQEQQVQQRQLQEQLQRRRQEEECWQLEQEQRSKQRDAEFHKQQEQLEKQKQEEQAKLDAQLQEEGRNKDELLRQQEQQIQQLSQQTAEEKAAFYKQQEEEKQRLGTQRQKAAAKIQAAFKSYKVRKIHGPVLKEKRENRKKSWALNRQLEIEKHKKDEELKQRLAENERKRMEEEKRQEEERKKKEEEERRNKELEEKARIEEERKRKEEEKTRMKEEEKRKQEEAERRKREEEERKTEEERKRKEEEERKKQEEEKKKLEEKKREEERQRLEEERRKKEEAERKEKEEQLRRIQEEDERRKLEEQEKKRREEEQKKIKEEARMKQEAEERVKTTGDIKTNISEHNNLDTQQSNSKDNSPTDRTVPTPEDMTAIADDIERRRLQWMESCRPWSQVAAELKRRKPKKGGRGAAKPTASAKNLPELTDEQLLQASKPGTPLDKVEEVNIEGLTGCSLSRLTECPGLLKISVNQCEAQVLYGVQRFTRLQHIDVNQNRLNVLVCTGCTSLDCLLATHNQLSSMNGLDGCNNLQVLDLSHNKITRIGGLDSCVHLQQLQLSHNQLISLRGLHLVPTLLHLDVSHNHLPTAEHLQDCGLLQHLNLASNTLTKPPSLPNHVLLRSLVLDDNSISSLDVLSTAWLPLLSLLSVKQNSLTEVSSLCHLIVLEHLDVSCNQLEDVPGVAGGVSACVRLHTLNVAGNPLTEDKSYRSDLVAAIPSLCTLDGEEVQQKSSVARDTEVPFVRMCLAQQSQWESVKQRHEAELKAAQQSGEVQKCLAVQRAHREECHQLAVDHRYAHEYGETDTSGPAVSEKDTGVKTSAQRSSSGLRIESAKDEELQLDQVVPTSTVATDNRTSSVGRTTPRKVDEDSTQGVAAGKAASSLSGQSSADVSSKRQGEDSSLQSVAAMRIQAVWRGYSVRRDIRQHTQDWLAAHAIQEAATKIQAAWRGHRLRLRLQRALQAARWEEEEEEEEDDEFREVDLTSFDLQAAELDQAWAPPQTPTLPTRHAVLGSVSSKQDRAQPMWDTRQAWQGAPPPPSPKHPLPPVKPPSRASSASSQHHPTPPTSRLGSVVSTKSEQLTEEWGFKSGTTAELMMKRARRMKARKKKTLDPHQRLALQRKMAEKEAPPTVRAPPRKQANRVDYFRAKEAMHQFLESAEVEPESVQEEQRQKMTYTWVHSQVGHLDSSPEQDRFMRRTGSTGTLPRLDPEIIATGRVQLVRTPPATQMDGLELESVDGTSASDLQSHRERRHSIEGDSPRETAFEPSPPKTNSAPSQKLRERLSRHSGTDKNAAWGSGRRKIQLFKM